MLPYPQTIPSVPRRVCATGKKGEGEKKGLKDK